MGTNGNGVLLAAAQGVAVTLLWATPVMILIAFVLCETGGPGDVIRWAIGVFGSVIFGAWMAREAGYFPWFDRD
ncbi:hypothetical protein A9762_12060 [Pandoraea sp. ISTKB]|nr:hypothetical protein A9762_12060 [Pandoraea sp. ISTKB]